MDEYVLKTKDIRILPDQTYSLADFYSYTTVDIGDPIYLFYNKFLSDMGYVLSEGELTTYSFPGDTLPLPSGVTITADTLGTDSLGRHFYSFVFVGTAPENHPDRTPLNTATISFSAAYAKDHPTAHIDDLINALVYSTAISPTYGPLNVNYFTGTKTVEDDGSIHLGYGPAQAGPAQQVDFGNLHVGDSVTQYVSVTNTAPADGLYENLDGTITTDAARITASGSFVGLVPQATDSNSLMVSIDTSSSGVKEGDASIAFYSDGDGLDDNGVTALPSQNVDVSGTVYAYADPLLPNGTVDIGTARVGDPAPKAVLFVSDGTFASQYQENLTYQLAAPALPFVASNTKSGTIASGDSAAVAITLTTDTAGDFSGSLLSLNFTSSGVGTSGLPDTALGEKDVALTGKVYARALPSTTGVDFGTVHVGDLAMDDLTVGNVAAGALCDLLLGGFGIVTGPFSGAGTLGPLGVTATTTGTLTVEMDTTSSGVLSGGAILSLLSHDFELPDEAILVGPLTLSGTVDLHAVPSLGKMDSHGTFLHTSTIDLGTIGLGTALPDVRIAVRNATPGQADQLSGSFSISGDSAFLNSGFVAFEGLDHGQSDGVPTVRLSTAQAGIYGETITLHGTGSNSSGFSETLAQQTLVVTGTVAFACFAAGTRILTTSGEVAVEDLREGDRLPTQLTAHPLPIIWIGRRRVDCRRHSRAEQVMPVRISPDSFGPGLPRRDLWLSPDHALYLEDILIPVKYLINGGSIAQIPVETVAYYHIETPRHSVVFAEGLPVETYLDTGDRANFTNGGAAIKLHPDFGPRVREAEGCAPLIVAGPQLAAVRQQLQFRPPVRRTAGRNGVRSAAAGHI